MAENRPSAPFDDADLRERLGRFASAGASASQHGPVLGVSAIRARAQQRRAIVAAASALAVAVVTAGVAGAVGWGGEQAAPNPAGPSPVVSPTTPTESPTTDPTLTEPPPTTQAPAREVPTTIPDDLRLPHEGMTEDGYTWAEGDATGALCFYPAVPDLPGYASVTDSRNLRVKGPEFSEHEELMVLESADAAVELMAQVRSEAMACPSVYGDPDETTVSRVTELDGSWGEGVLIALSFRNSDADPDAYVGGHVVGVIRTGSAVALFSTGGERFRGVSADGETYQPAVAEVRASLDEIAPKLCVFTQAGC